MDQSSNPYQFYHSFRDRSTSLNRALYSVCGRWHELGVAASYDDAVRFSHLVMFLSEIMAFEAFLGRCLRDQYGLSPKHIEEMNVEVKIRVLLPDAGRDATLPERLKVVRWAFNLRNTWMHGCGDPELTVNRARARRGAEGRNVPTDVFEAAEWVDSDVWSKAAAALTGLAESIATRFGWR
jgi:hypothetical protein